MRDKIPVLDQGYVQLLDSMGDDMAIVNAARTSFDQVSRYHHHKCEAVVSKDRKAKCSCVDQTYRFGTIERLSRADAGLINFLMENRHGTPFEMVEFKFAVKAPIFVFREWHRHRVASINEMSGRYVELPREFYVPAREDIRVQKGKPGAYFYETMDDDTTALRTQAVIHTASNRAFDEYEFLLKEGVAKEVARLVLPVNTYSLMVWKTNLRAVMNFLSLRNHEHAQREIMYYASVMEQIVSTIAPEAIDKFIEHGRRQP